MEEEKEIWRDISGYPGYKVSNMGRVKSLNYRRTKKEKILKPIKTRDGYFQIVLQNEGIYKHMYIHRLVCDAFIPNPLNFPQVNHRNEDKQDNRLENLEYCDAKYNSNYGTRNERMAKSFSKPVKCLETGKIYPSTMEIQRQLGFSQGNISECCNKKRKSVHKLHFEWEE